MSKAKLTPRDRLYCDQEAAGSCYPSGKQPWLPKDQSMSRIRESFVEQRNRAPGASAADACESVGGHWDKPDNQCIDPADLEPCTMRQPPVPLMEPPRSTQGPAFTNPRPGGTNRDPCSNGEIARRAYTQQGGNAIACQGNPVGMPGLGGNYGKCQSVRNAINRERIACGKKPFPTY